MLVAMSRVEAAELEIADAAKNRAAYELMTQNRAAALATADANGVPHVAIVYCSIQADLSLFFSTRVEGRKYRNLSHRPDVSLAFVDESNMRTVQLTGTAKRVELLACEQEILRELILLRYGEPNWPAPPVKLFERGLTNELAIVEVEPYELTLANFETNVNGRYKPFFTKII